MESGSIEYLSWTISSYVFVKREGILFNHYSFSKTSFPVPEYDFHNENHFLRIPLP